MAHETVPQTIDESKLEKEIASRQDFVNSYQSEFASSTMTARVVDAKRFIWQSQCTLAKHRGDPKPPYPKDLDGSRTMAERVDSLEDRVESLSELLGDALRAIKGKSPAKN